jgi:hypothetical protein
MTQPELNSAVSGIYRKGKAFMEVLDPLTLIVTQNLPRPAALVRVQTHTVRSILKQNGAVACRPVVRPVESAFPILAIPGFWEIVRTFRSEQGGREFTSDVDFTRLQSLRPTRQRLELHDRQTAAELLTWAVTFSC